ncbi:MAG: transposase domain-containing protein [Deltaproteobacteria bacterium]|jgi:hypothetical protein|nr:transposase domain-containing protein [Deltaproteobacteria bacterium]
MARNKKSLSKLADLTHLITVGFLTRVCPRSLVAKTLMALGKQSQRIRLFPAQAVVYFVILMSLWREPPQEEILRVVSESLSSMIGEYKNHKLPTKGAITKAREKLGYEALESLASQILAPLAPLNAPLSFYQGMRILTLEASEAILPDSKENAAYFGVAKEGAHIGALETPMPLCRVATLVESGTLAVTAARLSTLESSSCALAQDLILNQSNLEGTLILTDRLFSPELLSMAREKEAGLFVKLPENPPLKVTNTLEDGTKIAVLTDQHGNPACPEASLRILEFCDPLTLAMDYFGTTLMDPRRYPVYELLRLFKERLSSDTLFAEIKNRLGGMRTIVRSKVPSLVKQEIWGIIILHFAIRMLVSQVSSDSVRQKSEPQRLFA